MKKTILPISVTLFSTLSAPAQGYVNFSTRVPGAVVAHVYGDYDYLYRSGNTATETPAGTQTYNGPLITGSGFTAQLFAANGANQPEGSLIAVPGAITSFRSGAILAGTPAPLVVQVPFVLPGGTGTFQVRAWDNAGGTLGSYEEAIAYARPSGKSALFNVSGLGDGVLMLPADFANVQNFNIHTPEPTTTALLGLGALGLWLIRRQKRAA